jgi:dTDP-4-dehydrorhamnose 3,5-epimerase
VVGEVLDVAVDLRKSSPTFGRYVSTVLSADNLRMVWVPPGFAHGFFVQSEHAEFLYRATEYYSPEHERTLSWNDPAIGIDWGIPPGVQPTMSRRDREAPFLPDADLYL